MVPGSETRETVRAWVVAVVLALAAISGAPLAAQEAAPPRLYVEAPDDPPAADAPRDDPAARSPGARVQRGPFVSIQVNVDEAGQNIVGDAANEPSIAIDPLDPDTLVIGWRQFDNVASNFRQAGWAFSHDGGQSWTFPGVLEPGVFRSDPVLDTDSTGVFYYDSLKDTFTMDVFRSFDSGQTWPLDAPAFGGDKNWMAIDKSGGIGEGHVYGTWQRNFGCCGSNLFTRSTDGAASFEFPVPVTNSPSFGTMTVGPDGTVYSSGVANADLVNFAVSRSTDAQDAGSSPTFAGAIVEMGGTMGFGGGPNPDGLLGQTNVVVDGSGGPTHGNVYLLSSVNPPGSDPLDVHIARSTDGGATWSAPVRVNDDAGTNAYQWFGTLSVAPNGRLDAVWNDTRTSGQTNLSELFYAYSWDAGESWSENVAVSPSFDSFVGWPNQNKLGDYYTMLSDAYGGSLAWAATFNGEQDVYFLRVFPDCNGNGVSDVEDIENGDSSDDNGNNIPDECEDLGLVLAPPAPGTAGQQNSFVASGATPGATVGFARAFAPGSTPAPGCAGVDLDLRNAKRLGLATADGDGVATLTRFIPAGVSGRTLFFQAFDRVTCETSNVVEFTFD